MTAITGFAIGLICGVILTLVGLHIAARKLVSRQ